jgi:putative membrane protein
METVQKARVRVKNSVVRRIALPAFLALLLGTAWGQGSGPAENRSAANEVKLTRSDKSFLRDAAQENQAAIELGQVAEQKGFSAAARNFARTLVAQRSHAQRELVAVARTLGLALPHKLSRHDRKAKKELEKYSGAQVDRAFLMHMASDLDRQYGNYEDAGMRTQNPEVKHYVESVLSQVKRQDQVAKAIAPGNNSNSGGEQ